ncbi:hypothetical protein [Streptomyces coffeae]|uniref:Lipoprotein n=1 Tax=Streptomyces coffeae TaxID=621382 RepID=A0ABS1NDQ7_9ACTN|nr:hypothetical protein [Streptomyces coffeae]MBL1098208.1 hypothetical protein [Streptomyces coffeae]
MGALSHVRQRPGRPLLAVAVSVAAVVAVTGCDRKDNGVSSIVVAVTTDKVASRALEKGGVDVRWMTCNADLKGGRTAGASSSGDHNRERNEGIGIDASVDCRGETESDKDIKVSGKVTFVRKNQCVRGHLTASVDGHRAFEARVIGECDDGRDDDRGSGRDKDRGNDRNDGRNDDRGSRRPEPHQSYPLDHRTAQSTQGK